MLGMEAVGSLVVLIAGDEILAAAGYNATYIVRNRQFNATTATTGYAVWTGPLEAFGITGYMIAALPQILLGPLPWDLGPPLVWSWVLSSSLYWWLALILIGWVGVRQRLTAEFGTYLVMSAVLLVALAAFFSNYGVLARMRSLPLVVMLVILGGAVSLPTRRRSEQIS